MSQAKDIFFELLTPNIEALGYSFKKSKGSFDKLCGELCYSIRFSWDGRGGTVYLNNVSGIVHIPAIAKANRKLIDIRYEAVVWQERNECNRQSFIPQMYSNQLIELANLMRFKEMAAMPFEEKYPMDKIIKTVEAAKQEIISEIIPFHNTINNEQDILNWYIHKAEEQVKLNDYFNICSYAFPIKLMCKKLKIDEPQFIKDIDFFTKNSMDELWNLQSIDFKKLGEQFNAITF